MEEQINSLGKIAGSLSAIIALLALLLVNPIKRYIQRKRQVRREAKEELRKEKAAAREAEVAFRTEVREGLGKINTTLTTLTDDIADLQYERLSQAYEYYTAQGWCPGSKKEMLCQLHKSYRLKGRNHLSEHYEEEILHLDSKPRDQPQRRSPYGECGLK